MKQSDYTIYAANKKALLSCAASAKLICAFVFAYAKNRFLQRMLKVEACPNKNAHRLKTHTKTRKKFESGIAYISQEVNLPEIHLSRPQPNHRLFLVSASFVKMMCEKYN